jgi:DNA-binding MarR family transcriptional regulator
MKREESQNVEYKESWHDKHLYGFTDEQLVAAVDNSEYGVAKDAPQAAKTHHDTHHDEVPLKPNEIKLLQMLSSRGELGAADLRKAMKLRNAPDFRERYLRPLSRNGYIEFTLPNAKRSKLQKYRLTAKGRECLASLESRSDRA